MKKPDAYLEGEPPPTPNQIAWVMAHLAEHVGSNWSYRKMIYARLGLKPEHYALMQFAGALLIHNILTCWEEPDGKEA